MIASVTKESLAQDVSRPTHACGRYHVLGSTSGILGIS